MISDYLRSGNNSSPLGTVILLISISTWLLCGLLFYFTSKIIRHDINDTHSELEIRADKMKQSA